MSPAVKPNSFLAERFELFPWSDDLDVHARRIHSDFLRENPDVKPADFKIETAKAYVLFHSGIDDVQEIGEEILLNPVLDRATAPSGWRPSSENASRVIERRYRPGMTDNSARAFEEALGIRLSVPRLNPAFTAHRMDLFRIRAGNQKLLDRIEATLSHPLLHVARTLEEKSWSDRKDLERLRELFPEENKSAAKILDYHAPTFEIRELDSATLEKASKDHLWALSLKEMQTVQAHFAKTGRNPTLGEMEVIAQTWSEHCKHKIFRGTIHFEGPESIPDGYPKIEIPKTTPGLFRTTIKAVTDACPKPWLLSVFSDNAGILAFTPQDAVCIKVETHNSPSAIDPFAGAITGIGGVHRDIIGTGFGAKPLFNLDVFCVAPARFDTDRPDGIFPPSRILEGIRAGVEAGGNPAGIPTIAGALVFDKSYLGKPLVFCGSGGVLPREIELHPLVRCEKKEILSGDRIVIVGGRVGRDGIHGATFSSQALDTSDAFLLNSSVVQLGDPFTQKRALDFILKARDQGLFRTLTDNGAGGLSSSIGELATLSNGAKLDLTNAPLKAMDLRPEEILISESQERMSLAVPPECLERFLSLANSMRTEATDMGEFIDSGFFEVVYRGETVAKLDLEFLHEGCPNLEIRAVWNPKALARLPAPVKNLHSDGDSIRTRLLKLLGSENIRSKASLIRQYDHEVQGGSLVKPETQINSHRSPNQSGAVLLRPDSEVAAVIGVGILPEYSRYDAYTMAQASLDEAIRNVLCSGAEYGTSDSVLALLDNFCWPDPLTNRDYAADLVRAGYGLRDAALALELPFVSGKDSMKNDFRGQQNGKAVKISVLPTVLVTALGRIPDLARARTSEFKNTGETVYLLGPAAFTLVGSQFERIGLHHDEARRLPLPNWPLAKKLYGWLGSPASQVLRSCADISEGGLLTAISEGLFAYELGFTFDSAFSEAESPSFFYGEGFHTFIVSLEADSNQAVTESWTELGIPWKRLGMTTTTPKLIVGNTVIKASDLEGAWR
ncbi:MAG: phosphoribosylformylglycinamidine synthase [Cryobacterium sp.]|nr:phosphoribosylformylglycinamidine synthase [Oligoflexia bacterium]